MDHWQGWMDRNIFGKSSTRVSNFTFIGLYHRRKPSLPIYKLQSIHFDRCRTWVWLYHQFKAVSGWWVIVSCMLPNLVRVWQPMTFGGQVGLVENIVSVILFTEIPSLKLIIIMIVPRWLLWWSKFNSNRSVSTKTKFYQLSLPLWTLRIPAVYYFIVLD